MNPIASRVSRYNEIAKIVEDEFWEATAKFCEFNSPHEGYAIIKEELDELWEVIKQNGPKQDLVDEAKQVAAMAIRFIYDLCGV